MTSGEDGEDTDGDEISDSVDASFDFSTTPDVHFHMDFDNAPEGVRDFLNELGKTGAKIVRGLRESELEGKDGED